MITNEFRFRQKVKTDMIVKNLLTMFNKIGKFTVGDFLLRFTNTSETQNKISSPDNSKTRMYLYLREILSNKIQDRKNLITSTAVCKKFCTRRK
jgi:hypothetical protein